MPQKVKDATPKRLWLVEYDDQGQALLDILKRTALHVHDRSCSACMWQFGALFTALTGSYLQAC